MATRKLLKAFFSSPKMAGYWKALGVEEPLSCKCGRAAEREDFYAAIVQDGVVLYEKFRPGVVKGREILLFSWENVKPESKRVMLNRKLYGYKRKGKEFPGLLSQHGARRISKGAALVPAEHRLLFEELFFSYKTKARVYPLIEGA